MKNRTIMSFVKLVGSTSIMFKLYVALLELVMALVIAYYMHTATL